jgi:Uncharacterised protein family (UPF0172)
MGTGKGEGKVATILPVAKEIIVSPKAFVVMALHSVRYSHESVHGILVGRIDTEKRVINVDDAIPISHGPLTLPIVESVIGMIQIHLRDNNPSWTIVGSYTAPMLLDDNKANPVALRFAANLASGSDGLDPTLLVLQNTNIAEAVKNGIEMSEPAIKCFGRDFGNQWLDPISCQLNKHKGEYVGTLLPMFIAKGITVNDFVEHLNSPTTILWYPNDKIDAILS